MEKDINKIILKEYSRIYGTLLD